MIDYQVKTYYLCCSLFLLFRQSFTSFAYVFPSFETAKFPDGEKLILLSSKFSNQSFIWLPIGYPLGAENPAPMSIAMDFLPAYGIGAFFSYPKSKSRLFILSNFNSIKFPVAINCVYEIN